MPKKPKPGAPPGHLLHVGSKRTHRVTTSLISYSKRTFTKKRFKKGEKIQLKRTGVNWLNIDGVHDLSQIKSIGTQFSIHPLILEDIANTEQRPKYEEYPDYLFFTAKLITPDGKEKITSEHISFVLSTNLVISFQELQKDVFEPVRTRIEKGGRIIERGPDYLTYALIDAIVDHYFLTLSQIAERIEKLDLSIQRKTSPDSLRKIHKLKKETIRLKRSVWPLRDALTTLLRTSNKLVSANTKLYLRDVHDHAIQVIDTLESMSDRLNGMLELYLSLTSNRMNEIMKVLTIISTIFIPLTFITGIYGMNFLFMPELQYTNGYYGAWVVMFLIALVMILFFKRKAWL